MTRTFIQTAEFIKNWKKLDLTDDDLRRLEYEILQNPQSAPVIPGTGRLRKMRYAFEESGKRSSARVCYVDFFVQKTILLVTAYKKGKKDNLTKEECNNIKKMIDQIEIIITGKGEEE